MTEAELQKDRTSVSYRFLKGLILTRQEKLQQARDIFIDLTRTNPELPEPYNNLAVIYASMGDYDKAREALEQAINTHPAYATAHENIGDIYARLASQAYNQALELDSENNTAKAKLSLVNELFSLPETGTGRSAVVAALTPDRTAAEPVADPVPAPTPKPVPVSVPEPVVAEEAGQVPVREVPVQPAASAPAPVVEPTPAAQAPKPAPSVSIQPAAGPSPVAAVKQAVLDWSTVWSARDINAYLATYAADFTPPDGRSLDSWRELRRVRLSKSGNIKVTIADLVVEMTDARNARATFTQSYQSDVYSDRVKKSLLLRLENNRWLITREQT